MAVSKLTYLDSCVLIAAVHGDHVAFRDALRVLNDPDRQYATSEFVKLELIPKAKREGRTREIDFLELFFDKPPSPGDRWCSGTGREVVR